MTANLHGPEAIELYSEHCDGQLTDWLNAVIISYAGTTIPCLGMCTKKVSGWQAVTRDGLNSQVFVHYK